MGSGQKKTLNLLFILLKQADLSSTILRARTTMDEIQAMEPKSLSPSLIDSYDSQLHRLQKQLAEIQILVDESVELLITELGAPRIANEIRQLTEHITQINQSIDFFVKLMQHVEFSKKGLDLLKVEALLFDGLLDSFEKSQIHVREYLRTIC